MEERNRPQRPSMFASLTEVPRTLLEISHLSLSIPYLSMMPRGDGHAVLLIPGFMGGDGSLLILRRYLRMLGYQAETWGAGRNSGNLRQLFDHLPEKLNEMAEKSDQPVSMVGQSLGGIYARELAKEYPDQSRQVITLGSPFNTTGSEHLMRGVRQLCESSSGSSMEEMATLMRDLDYQVSPDLPVTAIYSRGDGVAHWQACMELEEDHQTQNIEVPGSHIGMAFNSVIYYIIADRLAQSKDRWEKYSCSLGLSSRAFA